MSGSQTVYLDMAGSDITVSLTCDFERCDYGVPRSPVWNEPTNVCIDTVDIDGHEYTEKQLCAAFGWLADEIIAAAVTKAEERNEWGEDEPDYDEDRY
jgi:hypothetical protein